MGLFALRQFFMGAECADGGGWPREREEDTLRWILEARGHQGPPLWLQLPRPNVSPQPSSLPHVGVLSRHLGNLRLGASPIPDCPGLRLPHTSFLHCLWGYLCLSAWLFLFFARSGQAGESLFSLWAFCPGFSQEDPQMVWCCQLHFLWAIHPPCPWAFLELGLPQPGAPSHLSPGGAKCGRICAESLGRQKINGICNKSRSKVVTT